MVDGEQKFLWPDVPRTAFQAFQPDGSYDYASSAEFAVKYGSFRGYATGYAEAARAVFRSLGDRRGPTPDLALFPLGFLWRHSFELQFKEIIWRGQELHEEGSGTLQSGHTLHDLWRVATPFIKELGDPDDPIFANVSSVIEELRCFDETAQAFRYPIIRKGRGREMEELPALHGIPATVDLKAFHEAMSAVANFLDAAISEQLERHSYELGHAAEYQRDYEER
jgi:hypothetical protein